MAYPTIPNVETGFRKMSTETTTAMTPLKFPSTCSVRALVCLVTRKLSRLVK